MWWISAIVVAQFVMYDDRIFLLYGSRAQATLVDFPHSRPPELIRVT